MYNIQEVFTLKKVLILSSSPRPTSNSDLLCDEFLRGAVAAGHTAQKIRLAGLALNPCLACDYCRKPSYDTDEYFDRLFDEFYDEMAARYGWKKEN